MRFFKIILVLFIINSCAKKGRPTGGEKDKTAPIMVKVSPEEKTNFNAKSIKINFDEYIVLRDLNKQLIISPPLKSIPMITPQGTPSKYIKINLSEDLRKNTTYTFNFGNAIQDNNEGNKLEAFKYVFSTGEKIDSLTLKGEVIDAVQGKLKANIALLLYDTTNFKDSIIYKQKPNYVTATTDSLHFKFTNIKKGRYKLFALQETANDYIFNSKTDKLAFLDSIVTLPQDSVIKKPLRLFKEKQAFKFKRASEIKKGKIQFRFKGGKEHFKIKLLSKTPKEFQSFSAFEKEKDSLNYWFTPIKRDSLTFEISNKKFLDTISVRLRKKKIDSLKVTPSVTSALEKRDTLFFNFNNPVLTIDSKKIKLTKDSVAVSFKIYDKIKNKLGILFDKKPDANYKITIPENTFVDFYQTTNKPISLGFRTRKKEEYGSINLILDRKIKSNLIFQLVLNKKVIRTKTTTADKISFKNILPNKYKIRVIIDKNNNNKWDTGNYLKTLQPEKIIYFNKELNLRANWEVEEQFVIE